MNEQETIKTGAQEATVANSKDGNKSEIDARIERINVAAQRLEEAERKLAEREAAFKEQEAIRRLGGLTDGAPQETKQVIESPKEYAERILKGKL